MENHTIVETDTCWIIGGKIIINKQPKPTKFDHWFEDFMYDIKQKLEEG